MIYKWNLVRGDVFEDIFNTFQNKQGNTEKLVLEIQNFFQNKDDEETVRVFFGNGINYEDWLKDNLEMYSRLKDSKSFQESLKGLKMCITETGSVTINPCIEIEDLIFKGIVNNDVTKIVDPAVKCLATYSQATYLNAKLIKDPITGDLRASEINKGGEVGYIRVRAMDLKDWKNNLKFYSRNGYFNPKFIENDLKLYHNEN